MLSRFFGRSARLAAPAAALSIALSSPFSATAATPPAPLKTAAAAEPWAASAFSARPAALLAAAQALPPAADQAIDFLWFETRLTLDADGLWTERQHQVYRVLDASEVDDWAYVEKGWSPWHQQKPELRARVIGLDGTERALDPKTIAEVSSGEDSAILFDDGKALRAPLPAVEVGAIVEIETFVRDQRPLFSAGSVRQLTFPSDRLRRARVEVDVAAEAPLHWVRRLLPENGPVERISGGRRLLTFEWRDLALKNDFVTGLPSEMPWYPYLGFSSAPGWQRVAAEYSAVVDRVVAGADVRAAVEAASQGAADQAQVIDRLLAYLQAQVRYTGVEFGDAGIVPRSPAETLARRYGDCKDKSTLLVALLRAADIPAYLALLSAGWGSDVDPELPGLGSFNHAIVYVPASPPIWIDATEELARAGELPAVDRDRWVLVAAPGTQALQKTPPPSAAENLLSRTRTVALAELGKAKIVEDIVYHGDQEIQARRTLGLADEKTRKELFKSYAESELLTEEIGPFRVDGAKDLSRPFTTRLEIPASPRGASDLNEAAVGIRLESLLERMPYVFLRANDEEEEEDDEAEEEETFDAEEEEAATAATQEAEDASATEEAGAAAAGAKSARKQPFVFRQPFVTEWRYEIHPPPGFVVREMPESKKEALGTASLERRYRNLPGGVMEAYFRFDSGKVRLSPEEFEATREKTAALAKGEPVLIYFDQVGAAALNQGRVAEALAEFRRLAALYPDRGLYPLQISRALLAGGLQEAAKAEAERAVALSPKLADAHQNLGWVLEHDSLGRLRGKSGFDRAGAVAAYKKAVALDPDNDIARADYAILLEFDEKGRQYGPGADLETAGSLFAELHEKGITGLDVNLMHNLLVRGKLDELKKFTNKTDASAAQQKYLAAVQALLEGPEAAARLARGVSDRDQRVAMLTFAGQQLLHKRRYAEAGKLFEILASVAPNAANSLGMMQWIASVHRWEDQEPPARVPATLLHRLMYLSLKKKLSPEEFRDHLSKQLLPLEIEAELKSFESQSFLETLSGKADGDAETVQFGLDLAMSLLRAEVAGNDDLGYRVKLRFEAMPTAPTFSLFVLNEEGEYRVLADNNEWAPVGRRVLDLAAAGRLDDARQWLDWARDSIDAPESVDPYGRRVFARLWTPGQKGDLEAVRAAGTVLIPESGDSDERPGPVKRAAYEDGMKRIAALRPEATGEVARAFDVATLNALVNLERWAEALPLAERLSDAEPGSDLALEGVALACRRLGRSAEAVPRLEARLAKNPNDLLAARLLAEAAESSGDIARSVALTRELVSRGKGEAHDWNRLAWDQLFEPKLPASALSDASHASELANHANPAILHTLASVYAELERPAEAYRVLLQSIEAGDRKIDPSDWYVFGRMAETYGLPDQARAYYRRVEKSETAGPVSAFVLAQRRLAGLGPETAQGKKVAKKAKA